MRGALVKKVRGVPRVSGDRSGHIATCIAIRSAIPTEPIALSSSRPFFVYLPDPIR